MSKKSIPFWALLLSLFLINTPAFAQDFQFATSFGSTSEDSGEDLVVDSQGNVIITGLFAGTVDFDPSSGGTFNMTSAGQDDGFVAKYDANGNFIWAVQFGGSSSDFGHGISVDLNDNIIVTGSFEGTADFLPASGGPTFVSQGAKDIFILKLDPNGALDWVEAMGGSDDDNGHDIDVDGAGNIHLAGAFSETVDFDPGAGTHNLTSDGNLDLFLARYDPDGNFLWAFNGEGGIANQRIWSVNADDAGNSYVSGWFKNNPDMDPGPGTFLLPNEGLADGYLGKYNANGDLEWVFNFGSASRDQGMKHSIDAAGNVYIGGFFRNTVDFDPGAGELLLTATGTQDAFLAKYNTDGEVQWAFGLENAGGQENSQGLSTTTDANGNTSITGLFFGTMDIDPGPGVNELIGPGGNDAFLATYNTDGELLWGGVIGGSGADVGKGIISDNTGNIYLTGTFRGTADFDMDPVATANMTSTGLSDVFLVKYVNLSTGNPLPVADFTYTEDDLTIDFDGSGSTDDGSVVSWDWDFGDGNTGSGEFVSHTYAVLGTYDVTLTVTDDLGGTDALTQTIDVGNPPPVPSFTATQVAGILDVEFDASATTDDGTISDWSWDFGDGTTGSGMTTIHPYAATGTYSVTLTVTDDEGAMASITQDVDVVNEDPIASFTTTQTTGTLDVDFDASASSDDGTITTWDWDLGDGNTGSGEMLSHTYAAAGTYTVMLTVTDNLGATGTTSTTIDVAENVDPVAAFTATQTAGTLDVDFDGSGSTDDGTITDWDWDFGDGNTGVGETVAHTYAAPGTYSVTLTVTDDAGATGSVTQDVEVTDPNEDPVASFTATQVAGTFDVDFDGSGSTDDGTITDWDWDFGDGNTGAGETVTHSYAADGTYTVMLTVTDDGGKTNTATQDVTVTVSTGTMHVESIATVAVKTSPGMSQGEATVTIHDENGVPVEGATVSGTFSGDLSGTDSQVTDANGVAVLISDAFGGRPMNIGFCVDDVTHASLTYDSADNGDPSFDCSTAAPSARALSGLDMLQVEANDIPDTYALHANYPNPFNPTTTISFDLPEASDVLLEVYDMMGRRVATLVSGQLAAGVHQATWNALSESGDRVASGVYLYRLQAGSFEFVNRMVLMK